MSKLRVVVVYGGPSHEHEVSIKTGKAMLANLDVDKYQVQPVIITQDGKWKIGEKRLEQDGAVQHLKDSAEFVLIGLHGTFGEDGTVQALLEEAGIPYSGSDSVSSKQAMEKDKAALKYSTVGLSVPEEVVVESREIDFGSYIERLGLPLVVKPVAQGSSLGVSIVESEAELPAAVEKAFMEDSRILLQQYIKGREVSCGVIEDSEANLLVLPPTEMIPLSSRFFDYAAKYTVGGADEVTPPKNMSEAMIERIQEYGKSAHVVLGCSGYSRTDMIVDGEKIYVIETNTLPGMTETSILPQQAAAQKIAFSEILDMVIAAGLRRSGV